jgi:tetratricopeptide (TPR) repeat protein
VGVILLSLGRLLEALAAFDRSLAQQPKDATVTHNRGLALMGLGRYEDARKSFQRTLQLAPSSLAPKDFSVHFQLGIALARLDRKPESVAAFDAALACDPRSAESFNNRGAVLVRLFRPSEALTDFQRAIELNPVYVDAYTNYGNTLKGVGQYSAALAPLNHALALRPGDPEATWSKAILLLLLGEWTEGWPLYESRLQREPVRSLQREFNRPRWTGKESLQGRSVLVHAEQGLGDTLQFARYIRPLEELGAKVTFEVQPALLQLLRSLRMQGILLARGDPLPNTDFHVPLLSLPLALGTTLNTIPGGVPYVSVDAQATHLWKKRLGALPGRKIGINWHGNPRAEQNSALQARSFPLAAIEPLTRVPGITIVSLQKGAGAEQRKEVTFADRVVQLTDPARMGAEELATETAAILQCLDLLITADTALAHLAGALGVPVWVVLQSVADWRWLVNRTDTPWYPSMRLWRQHTAGDWPQVFERIAQELEIQAR